MVSGATRNNKMAGAAWFAFVFYFVGLVEIKVADVQFSSVSFAHGLKLISADSAAAAAGAAGAAGPSTPTARVGDGHVRMGSQSPSDQCLSSPSRSQGPPSRPSTPVHSSPWDSVSLVRRGQRLATHVKRRSHPPSREESEVTLSWVARGVFK